MYAIEEALNSPQTVVSAPRVTGTEYYLAFRDPSQPSKVRLTRTFQT